MKNFNLIEKLQSNGFEEHKDPFGFTVYTLTLKKTSQVAFYGEYESQLEVQISFNSDNSVCRVNFYKNGSCKPFKTKVYDTVGKRTWNAIVETIKFNDFELPAA